MKSYSLLVPCFLLVAFASTSKATQTPIPIQNYSFLSADSSYNYDATQTAELDDLTAPPDWTVLPDATGDVYGTANPVGNMYAGTGGNAANGGTDPGSEGLLPGTGDGYTFDLMNLSTLADATTYTYDGSSLGKFQIGGYYELTLAIGLRSDETSEGSPDYTLELLNNGVETAETPPTLATLGTFTDLTLDFDNLSDTGTIGIAIIGADNSGSFQQANFDNVRLTVPEPSTYAEILGGCALLGLFGYNRRRLRA
jgi:hypothetical protein